MVSGEAPAIEIRYSLPLALRQLQSDFVQPMQAGHIVSSGLYWPVFARFG